jgi:hypothetical protein
MLTSLRDDIRIEDLRSHPAETVAALESLLAAGARISPDPKREGFYEVEGGARTYYIHVSPVTGKVLLLATWPSADVAAVGNQAARY